MISTVTYGVVKRGFRSRRGIIQVVLKVSRPLLTLLRRCSAFEFGSVECCGMSRALADQPLDLRYGLDSASSPQSGAVQRRSGTTELELPTKRPALQQRVNESAVKDVACSGGIHSINPEGGCMMELLAVPSQRAVAAKSNSDDSAAVAPVEGRQRVQQVCLACEPRRELAGSDQVIHILKQSFNSRIDVVHVGRHRNSGLPRPVAGDGCRGGVVPVEMHGPGAEDPFSIEFFWANREAGIAPPQDGALTGWLVHEDEGCLARAAGNCNHARLDAGAGKLALLQFGGPIVAHFADVSRTQAPLLAGNQRARHLAAGMDLSREELDLGIESREMGQADQSIGGVQADAGDIDDGELRGHAGSTVNQGNGFSSANPWMSASDNFDRLQRELTYRRSPIRPAPTAGGRRSCWLARCPMLGPNCENSQAVPPREGTRNLSPVLER